jgi:hypothetical protein
MQDADQLRGVARLGTFVIDTPIDRRRSELSRSGALLEWSSDQGVL